MVVALLLGRAIRVCHCGMCRASFGVVPIRRRLCLEDMADLDRRAVHTPRLFGRCVTGLLDNGSMAVQKGILALQMRALRCVSLLVTGAQICADELAIATCKVAAVYLLRLV